MHKILCLLAVLCSTFFIGSCQSSKSFEKSADKAIYLTALKSKSITELQKSLKTDLAYVDTLLADAKNTQLAFSFGMSFSSGDDKEVKEFDIADPYQLHIAKDSMRLIFNQDIQELNMEQRFIYPNSQLEVDYPDKAEGGQISLKLVKMYSKDAVVKTDAVGLKRVDSAEVYLSYVFPKEFERWDISSGDSASYNGEVAVIEKMEGKEVDFTMPQSLYRKILSYQAITKDGRLMNHTSFSAFPVTVVKRSIINELTATQILLKKASEQSSEEEVFKLLEQIPEHVFESKNQLQNMQNGLEDFDKIQDQKMGEMIASIKKIIQKYANVLSPEEQSITLKFPADVYRVYLYMGKNFDSLTATGMARNFSSGTESYMTYQDSASTQFGIIDASGNILIKADYKRPLIHQEGTNYFNTYPQGSYYLDAEKKKLIEIKDKTFVRSIDKMKAIFQDSLDYLGVLQNNDKMLLPFEFDRIDEAGDLYVVKKSLRGRSRIEILDSKGKTIINNLSYARVSEERNCILLTTNEGLTGILGTDGKYTLQPQALMADFVGKGPILSYSTTGQTAGLMDKNGKKITPEKYYSIKEESEGLLIIEADDNYLKGYISPSGTVVIPPQFNEAEGFNMGLALIQKEDGKWHLIDKTGKVVISIPISAGRFYNLAGSGVNTIYHFENQNFDYKGKLSKIQPND